jgi:hypothetical protein
MDKNVSRLDGSQAEALASLRASIEARDALDRVIAQQVKACRRADVGWQEIADVTGVSKPTAIARWKERDDMTTMTVNEWTLEPGDTIRRKELHDLLGGSNQGGIAPSSRSDNVFLFAEVGEEHGYVDGPRADGTYDYTGEGQYGDQVMARGNRAIRDHLENGKALRLFRGARGEVTYLGEYEYDSHRTETIRATHGPGQRRVFVFKLRQVR